MVHLKQIPGVSRSPQTWVKNPYPRLNQHEKSLKGAMQEGGREESKIWKLKEKRCQQQPRGREAWALHLHPPSAQQSRGDTASLPCTNPSSVSKITAAGMNDSKSPSNSKSNDTVQCSPKLSSLSTRHQVDKFSRNNKKKSLKSLALLGKKTKTFPK